MIGPGQVGYGLHGLGNGYGEAEGVDLPDVVAQLAVDIDAGLVVAVAEVGVWSIPGFVHTWFCVTQLLPGGSAEMRLPDPVPGPAFV